MEEMRQEVMEREWRDFLSLLIEKLSKQQQQIKDYVSIKTVSPRPSKDGEFKATVAVIEAVKRLSLRKTFSLQSSVFDEKLPHCLHLLKTEMKKRYDVCLHVETQTNIASLQDVLVVKTHESEQQSAVSVRCTLQCDENLIEKKSGVPVDAYITPKRFKMDSECKEDVAPKRKTIPTRGGSTEHQSWYPSVTGDRPKEGDAGGSKQTQEDVAPKRKTIPTRGGSTEHQSWYPSVTGDRPKEGDAGGSKQSQAYVPGPAIRIILIGRTGYGKSSLGNSLLSQNLFTVGRGMRPETRKCDWQRGRRSGIFIELVDTPGLCDTDKGDDVIFREVGKSVALAYPGPHLIVLALRTDRRFTKEEYQAYVKLKELFSEEMSKYLIIVFNGMDGLGDAIAEQKKALDEEVKKMPGELKQVLQHANYRYVGMNNKASPADKETLLQEVMIKFLDMVRANGNKYYKTRLICDINAHFEGLIQNTYLRRHVTRWEAERQAKRAVVTGEDEEFSRQLHMSVQAYATSYIRDICSVM